MGIFSIFFQWEKKFHFGKQFQLEKKILVGNKKNALDFTIKIVMNCYVRYVRTKNTVIVTGNL